MFMVSYTIQYFVSSFKFTNLVKLYRFRSSVLQPDGSLGKRKTCKIFTLTHLFFTISFLFVDIVKVDYGKRVI